MSKPVVEEQLTKVYVCLTAVSIISAIGVSVPLFTETSRKSFPVLVGTLSFFLLLLFIPGEDERNFELRLLCLFAFAFLLGVSMGPPFEQLMDCEPSIFVKAFTGTAIVFLILTLLGLLIEGSWTHIERTLSSLLSLLIVLIIVNICMGSLLLHKINLSLGLVINCGYVLYDTATMMEQSQLGKKDTTGHSLNLFLDFYGILIHLIVLLLENDSNTFSQPYIETE